MLRFGLIIFIFLSTHLLFAQDDDTIQFKQGLPETFEDSAGYDKVQKDFPPSDFVKVTPEQIPSDLRSRLEKDELFSNWESQAIYFDQDSELYWLEFRKDETVRRYAFNKQGDPVSIREISVDAAR